MLCFVLVVMGLHILCFMFTPLRAPIVGSAHLGVIFCLDSGPSFFSYYVPLLGVFPLFIYLFMYL
jgi:hypothetical protein